MLGGDIVQLREGHPTKGTYWSPTYNSTEGIKALGFIKDQIDAGIKPQINHFWGQEFADKKFAVMLRRILAGPTYQKKSLGTTIYPNVSSTYNKTQTSTLMGGWLFKFQ